MPIVKRILYNFIVLVLFMEQKYEARAKRGEFHVQERDGMKLTIKMANDLKKMLNKKQQAVEVRIKLVQSHCSVH